MAFLDQLAVSETGDAAEVGDGLLDTDELGIFSSLWCIPSW